MHLAGLVSWLGGRLDEAASNLLKAVEDVLLNKDNGATERLIDFAENIKGEGKRITKGNGES